MPYIDTDYIDAFVGPEVRQELFTDSGTYDSSKVDAVIAAAEARVRNVLGSAGYDPPTSIAGTTDEVIKQATLGQWIIMAYKRPTKSLTIPTDLRQYTNMLPGILDGSIKPDSLALTKKVAGVGGVKFSSSSSTASDGRPPRLTRDDLEGY